MKVLGFRFCTVSPEAANLAAFFDAIGFERHPLEGGSSEDGSFTGAVYAAGESWLAMWPPGGDMPTGMMLQVVVDDADAFAEQARSQGLNPAGPAEAQGKRIYLLQAPTGLLISIQSRLQTRNLAEPRSSLAAPPPQAARAPTPAARVGGVSSPPPAPVRAAGKSAPPPAPARAAGPSMPLPPGRAAARPVVAPPRAAGVVPPPRANAMPIPPARPGAFRRAPRS
jgi:hypothetical protein